MFCCLSSHLSLRHQCPIFPITVLIGEAPLNRVGYTREICHEKLVEMANDKKKLMIDTKLTRKRLKRYQGLPIVNPNVITLYFLFSVIDFRMSVMVIYNLFRYLPN